MPLTYLPRHIGHDLIAGGADACPYSLFLHTILDHRIGARPGTKTEPGPHDGSHSRSHEECDDERPFLST